jgi:hypothetical protein
MNAALELFDAHPMLVNVVLVITVCFASCLIGLLVLHVTTKGFERKARRAREREAARTEPL